MFCKIKKNTLNQRNFFFEKLRKIRTQNLQRLKSCKQIHIPLFSLSKLFRLIFIQFRLD